MCLSWLGAICILSSSALSVLSTSTTTTTTHFNKTYNHYSLINSGFDFNFYTMSTTISRHDSVNDRPEDLAIKDLKLEKSTNYAYITLLTRSTYLAGVVLLAHSLRKQSSRFPLIVLYTPTLEEAALRALQLEAPRSNLVLNRIELLIPAEHHELNVAVERFTDTWTKLRVFENYAYGYSTICYLDADMLLFKNMDSVFDDADKLAQDSIAAVHDCVCSPDKMPWTPADHSKENCPLTAQKHPEALTIPMKVESGSRPTYQLFNSGMFLYHPSPGLWKEMLDFFNTTDLLGTFKFPDQDFMIHFFRGRWTSLSWKYNAVKTMAYRHQNLWRAEEIVNLHYIVDKPWSKRIDVDGIAGFKGKDGESHRWWWEAYEAWFETRQAQGEWEVVTILSKHVARRESEMSDIERPNISSIGMKVHGDQDVAGGQEIQNKKNGLDPQALSDALLDAVAFVCPAV